jgi:hypothetical protein
VNSCTTNSPRLFGKTWDVLYASRRIATGLNQRWRQTVGLTRLNILLGHQGRAKPRARIHSQVQKERIQPTVVT